LWYFKTTVEKKENINSYKPLREPVVRKVNIQNAKSSKYSGYNTETTDDLENPNE